MKKTLLIGSCLIGLLGLVFVKIAEAQVAKPPTLLIDNNSNQVVNIDINCPGTVLVNLNSVPVQKSPEYVQAVFCPNATGNLMTASVRIKNIVRVAPGKPVAPSATVTRGANSRTTTTPLTTFTDATTDS